MSEVRRSSRIRTKSYENASATEGGTKDEQILNGSDGESDSENESESEGDIQDDEDYEEPSKKRRADSNSKVASRQKRAKSAGMSRPSTTSKQEQETYLEAIKDFQPTELFEILSTSEDVSIDELLRNWLESYSTDRDDFLQDFINLLLCCCGAIARLEAHDVHSNESSNETVGELQLLFQKQKIHEFHLLISKNNKKKTKYPHLYANFVEFMSRLMDIANDLQLLYVESDQDESEISTGPLVLDLLTWLSPLSVCKIRSLRYVATLTLYLFQDFLADHVVDLDKNYLSKLSKQLAAENKKKKPNHKTLEKIESSIAEIQGSKMVTQGIIDNIIKLCFVHRFKDVDEVIRCESMIHLSTWIKSYPEYFLKVTFLKYFGWLLSDSSANVRLQVLRILPNLIVQNHRKAVDNSAVRQFFERFKDRILEIALKDVNLEVKLSAVNVLVEVASLGYLEDGEILRISSLIFEDNKVNISSHGRNSRYLGSVAKFISCITEERYQEFARNRDLPKSLFEVESSSAVKVGIFMSILNDSLAEHFREEAHSDAETKIRILFQAAEFLYPYFGSLINDLCRMLIFEGDFTHPSLQATVEPEENNLTLLLPTDSNNLVLYVTTLHGLSYGGKYAKSQSRFKVTEAILPHLEKLIKHLPIESSNILSSVLGIFNLFSFEDWLHTGCEKDIKKIVEKIIKAFNETSLCSGPEDVKYKSFLEAVEHVRRLAFNELDELWLNHITYLKIHLLKFLGEQIQNSESSQGTDDDKMVNALYGSFLNKLTLLGKVYPIEFEDKLLDLFLNGYVRRVPAIAAHCQLESVQQINFKLLSLLSTWQLQKWIDLLEKSSENTVPSQVPISSFKTVKALLDSFYSIFKVLASDLNDNDGTLEDFLLKWSAANSFIDILISLKVFELGVADSERSWKNALREQFPQYIQESANLVFLQVFLYLESLYANESSIQLDRNPEEDANLNDIKYAGFEGNSEKELLLFTIKLKAVMKLGVRLSNDHIATRISLNKEKLGVLYIKVIDDKSFEGSKEDKASGRQQLLKDHSNEELEPIDEQSQEDEPAEISMIGHDSIDDSEI